jgi:hypothetical protein
VTTGNPVDDRRLNAGLIVNGKRKNAADDRFDSTDAATCAFHLELV